MAERNYKIEVTVELAESYDTKHREAQKRTITVSPAGIDPEALEDLNRMVRGMFLRANEAAMLLAKLDELKAASDTASKEA